MRQRGKSDGGGARASSPSSLADVLDGAPLSRRAMLRLSAGAALGLPLVLAACGTTTKVDWTPNGFLFESVFYRRPQGDLMRLIARRAEEVNIGAAMHAPDVKQLPDDVSVQTRLGAFDPRANRKPPVSPLVVVPAIEPGALAPRLATAQSRGVKVIGYPAAVPHQDVAILVDATRAATMLAGHAASWATARGGRGSVLLLTPASDSLANDPFGITARDVEGVFRSTLASQAPGLTVAAAVPSTNLAPFGSYYARRALKAHPDITMVLSWDDEAARGAAQALHEHHGRDGAADDLYVGALALPGVTSRTTLVEMRRGRGLDAIVATRQRDFATAMVDLSHAVLEGQRPGDVRLPLYLLTPDAKALPTYERDYGRHPDNQVNPAVPLNEADPNRHMYPSPTPTTTTSTNHNV